MIKENEIRVGNYYNRTMTMNNSHIGPTKFDQSDWYRVGECIDGFEQYDDIPLTDEMLSELKKQLPDRFEYRFSHGLTYIDFKGNLLTAVSKVHEIQNFVFVITGRELDLESLLCLNLK